MMLTPRMMTRGTTAALACLAILALAAVPACQQDRVPTTDEAINFDIRPSTNSLLVGEVLTVTTHSENTLGRDSRIEWRTTGGQLNTEQQGRIARVQFDEAGTYTVEGTLIVDDRVFLRDSTQVEVRPLR